MEIYVYQLFIQFFGVLFLIIMISNESSIVDNYYISLNIVFVSRTCVLMHYYIEFSKYMSFTERKNTKY